MVDRRKLTWLDAIKDIRVIIAAVAALFTAIGSVGTNIYLSDEERSIAVEGHRSISRRLFRLDSLMHEGMTVRKVHASTIDSLIARQNSMLVWRTDTVGPSLRYLVCMEMEIQEALSEHRVTNVRHCKNELRTVRQLLGNGGG